MVSTRGDATTTPARRSRSTARSPSSTAKRSKSKAAETSARSPSSGGTARRNRTASTTRSPTSPSGSGSSSSSSSRAWAHVPSQLTLLWLFASLPLVVWDAGYVLLRPLSMPGGRLHSPLWKPYALYGKVDLIYGWKAFESRNGFTAAQTWMNLLESAGYVVYLWIVMTQGRLVKPKGRGATPKSLLADVPVLRELAKARQVTGRQGAVAALLIFACGVMTVAKTLLYLLNEYCSGFDNIGHNHLQTLVLFYILPNGLWLVFPTYLVYIFGKEILQGLQMAAGRR